ncbi:MAG: carboxypeptidase, partial [Gammaproteobacteria bacterium]|nr:carboxypeptidase [Gammaproteobacteria bacterium]
MRRIKVLCCLLAALFPIAATAADHPELKYDVVVVNAFFDDKSMVAELAQHRPPLSVDYKKNFLTVEVTQSGYNELLKAGFRVELNERMTAEFNRVHQRLPNQRNGIDGFSCYRTVTETYASAAALAQNFPGLASWLDIGDSWEKTEGLGGHDLHVLVLTNSAVSGPKPRLFAMSAVHAREYTTAELTTRFAEHLLNNYGVDADVSWLLDHHEIHLVLQSNPDGRVQAQTGLSWRKNTNQNSCSATSNSRGIDLNRNFPFQWGCCNGSSGSQCSATYRGTAPASEPETQAIRDYVSSIFADQREDDLFAPAPADTSGVFLDIHSFSELVLWPWGFGSQLAPNGDALQTLGRKFGWFNDYFPEQAIGLYPTDGTTDDFAYGELGLAAYTFELGTTFFQDCGSFENTILPDNLEALMYAAKVARAPYLLPAGPDTLAVSLSDGVVAPGTLISLNAVADDSRFSAANGTESVQSIAAAEFFLDTPPWQGTAQANAMSAGDGNFNSSSETLVANIDTSGLSVGRHTVFVRAQDAAGNWGPVSA